jgi:hypothetical protein
MQTKVEEGEMTVEYIYNHHWGLLSMAFWSRSSRVLTRLPTSTSAAEV